MVKTHFDGGTSNTDALNMAIDNQGLILNEVRQKHSNASRVVIGVYGEKYIDKYF